MTKSDDVVSLGNSSLSDYFDAHRRRKESVSHAKEHINMIAETLLYLSEKDSDCSMTIKLSMMAEMFKSLVSDIDNGVSDKQAVKSFTNNLGLTTSNARPSYDTLSAYQEIEYECHNTFSWLEDGAVIKKMFTDGANLKGLTARHKKLLPKDFKFHPRKSLAKSIEIVAKKYSISPSTLKTAYLASRKADDIQSFYNNKSFYAFQLKEEGVAEEEISRIIDRECLDTWMKKRTDTRKNNGKLSGFIFSEFLIV